MRRSMTTNLICIALVFKPMIGALLRGAAGGSMGDDLLHGDAIGVKAMNTDVDCYALSEQVMHMEAATCSTISAAAFILFSLW